MDQSRNVAEESSHRKAAFLKEPSRFPNLAAAGRALAPQLNPYRADGDCIVLGIALAGIPAAREVAAYLDAPLDLVIVRRLLASHGPGSQSCAVNVAGSTVLDVEIIPPSAPSSPLEYFIADALAELSRREQICRGGRPPIALTARTVILVDCGIRTGSTMAAAARSLRKLQPKQIVGAVPVASTEGLAAVGDLFDELVCLGRPEQFVNAGFWYEDFGRPNDEEVGALFSRLSPA